MKSKAALKKAGLKDADCVYLSIVSTKPPDLKRKQNLRKKKSHSLAKLTEFLPSRIAQKRKVIIEERRKNTLKK